MHRRERYKSVLRILFPMSLLLFLTVHAFVFAGGTGHHHHENESDHMQSMLAIKKNIPPDYTIMERTPVIPDEDSIDAGRSLFLENCSVCHGVDGKGDGPSSASLKVKPASFHDKEHSSIYKPGEKYWIIGNGIKDAAMPAFPALGPLDRWHLVNFILSLQK